MAGTDGDQANYDATRLIAAALLIPIAAVLAYHVALYANFESESISSTGSYVGVAILLGATLFTSQVAHEENFSARAGTAIALASAYFLLTWVPYGDPSASPDAQPHVVWYGLCLVAFMPAVVLIPMSKWGWSVYRSRVPLN